MEHDLKTYTKYFNQLQQGEKTFELRKDDRDYKVDDIITLSDYCPLKDEYLGRCLSYRIIGILSNCEEFGLMKGYCILSIKII